MESIEPTAPLESGQQMDAYLLSLGDFRSALSGFERLADLVLASDESSQSSSDCGAAFVCSPAPPSVAFQPPSSPGGQSSASSVNCCASCTSNWPSATPFSSSAFSSSSGSSVVSYSQCSSNLSSTRSSSCTSSLAGRECGSSSSSSSSLASSSGSSSSAKSGRGRRSTPGDSRRKKNATAAERYRKKLKGRRFGLEGELEMELERNSQLRRSLEAKLELYREFADLLAQNTRDERDCELADLGSRSLATILKTVWPAGERHADARQRAQLEQLLAHFRLVQQQSGSGSSSPSSSSNSTLANESDEFECDFYHDRLVLAPQVY